MKLDNNSILCGVREWLGDSGVKASLYKSVKAGGKSGSEILMLELKGSPVEDLARKYGTDGKLILRWIMPYRDGGVCDVTDFLSGDSYSSGYIFRRPEFDRRNHDGTAPLHLCPDLDKGSVFPAWYSDIKYKWTRFAKNIINGKCYLENFIRLEAGLNAIYTSGSARSLARFTKKPGDDMNPLLALETSRQVLIDWPSETLGRIRIPHSSHEKRLCPFQTPESKRIGLQLNLAAGARVDDGKIIAGDDLFSVACGLIPYPHHTDGPRLMMGGKNMKQSEPGITGAEAPIVPGYYEGDYSGGSKIPRSHMKDGRFFPYLGLNALTVIMPFKGFTYEDGLVISESLASRLRIKEGSYSISRKFEVIIRESDLAQKGIKIYEPDKIFIFNPGGKYIYGDNLPEPPVNFYSTDNPAKIETWHERYDHHAPGISRDIKIRSVIKKISGSKNDKRYEVEFIVSWNFTVDRPMSIGDKLTGRNGNKGVVTKILPDDEMPVIHFADGESLPAELIISPCSIIGRKNLGQIWEMTHSLLIMKGGCKLHALLNEAGLDIRNIHLDDKDDENIMRIKDNIGEFLCEAGCDEWGAFDVTFGGKNVKAFAGWQYFCRLHHHAWKKLQARGSHAPYDSYNGQPIRCGSLTGQRLGEMENWAFLSHGAEFVLSDMRIKQTGNYDKTRTLFRKILRSLGIVITKTESGLDFSVRQNDDDNLERKTLRNVLSSDSEKLPYCGIITKEKSPLDLARDILGELEESRSGSPRVTKAIAGLREIIDGECFFNPDGSIHTEPEILSWCAETGNDIQEYGSVIPVKRPSLKKLLQRFCAGKNSLERAESLIAYRDGLIEILSGKTGIPRFSMAGRRCNHSGRAVIVPEPSLDVDCVYLPAAMLAEILDGYDDSYVSRIPPGLRDFQKLRKIFSDYHSREPEARGLAKRFDDFLMSDNGELWCFMIRQPSLHRHSVQSFRARCWEFPVIGIPPFVTPGFSADFDGDTMAAFIPPYGHAKDLSRFSILNNPGLIGSGKIAFADSLDLALGLWNTERVKLSARLAEILRNTPRDELRETLRKLQAYTAESSSGAATLTPIEFERLSRDMQDNNFPHGLNVLINSGAKGSGKDKREIADSIGDIDMMKDTDEDSESTVKKFIGGNFWDGLSDSELFMYSYPCRFSIAQKKLSVAPAGYLSRLLAEKLYECTVSVNDCRTSDGLEISCSSDFDRLMIDGEILPTLGDLLTDAQRVLWGRVLAVESRCLDSDGVKRVLDSLKEGGKVKIRSPLTCREMKHGHVCAKCYGADIASKPFDKPEPVKEGFAAGLTAAEAIGERGTQLAMKRFHDVTAKHEDSRNDKDYIRQIRSVLAGKNPVPLSEVIKEILTVSGQNHTANKELPQSMIHFETAAAYSPDDGDKYLSDIAGEKIARLLVRKPGRDFHFSDSLTSMKSRLIWEGGKNHNGTQA